MVITTNLLAGKYDFPALTINPINFKQLLDYIDESNKPDNDIAAFMKDVDLIVSDDPNCYELKIYDVDYVIFRKKLASVSNGKDLATVKLTCPNCGKVISKVISSEDIRFKKLDNYPKAIELGGSVYKLRIPTLREFLLVSSNVMGVVKSGLTLETLKLISLFDNPSAYKIMDIVFNATGSDIVDLLGLTNYTDSTESVSLTCDCSSERRVVSVGSLITDIFRCLLDNNTTKKEVIS